MRRELRPLTDTGAELRNYLKGVKLYIGLAEADRLHGLQSPEGAARSVYRQEKDWSGVLGGYYAKSGTAPDWYPRPGMFQAAVLSGAVSGFSGGRGGGGV